ncbi:MAG: MATE family efflux transporter, partial [Phoenicibacter congonensis]|nr:MATE family efflux transporter [Phoenicibacter congonensis]
VGSLALTGVGVCLPLILIISAFAALVASGGAPRASIFMGKNDHDSAEKTLGGCVTTQLIISVIVTFVILLWCEDLLFAFGASENTIGYAADYMRIYALGTLFVQLTLGLNSFITAQGFAKTGMYTVLIGAVLNIVLDLLFMGPLGLGVGGAALATVLSQGISAALGFFYILRREPDLHFGKEAVRVPRGFVPDMFLTGLSMALMSAIYSIGSVILQGSINALGNVYIAAQVGGRRLAELFYMPGVALGASVATYASQNFGANRRRRIVQGQWVALAIYGVWWLFALAFTFTAAPAAIRLITGSTNPDVLENALLYLHVSIPMVPPMAVVVIVRNALQGMKHTVAPLICSTMELVCKAIFGFRLVPLLGYPAVCACEPVAWVICMVFILAAAYAFRNDFRDTREVRA